MEPQKPASKVKSGFRRLKWIQTGYRRIKLRLFKIHYGKFIRNYTEFQLKSQKTIDWLNAKSQTLTYKAAFNGLIGEELESFLLTKRAKLIGLSRDSGLFLRRAKDIEDRLKQYQTEGMEISAELAEFSAFVEKIKKERARFETLIDEIGEELIQ